jgi:hypothetical protein
MDQHQDFSFSMRLERGCQQMRMSDKDNYPGTEGREVQNDRREGLQKVE